MISVLFQTESRYPVNRRKVKEIMAKVLAEKATSNSEVSISIVGDRRMRALNRKYRQVDETTDVLSFPLNDPTDHELPFIDNPDQVLRLGDIIVSYPQAVDEARLDNVLVDDKIIELLLHGLNHLLGIHHPE